MNSASVERLLLKRGEQPTAAHLNSLSAAVAQQQPLGGANVRRRSLPWGTHEHYSGGSGVGGTSSIFRPSIGGNQRDGFTVSWERGLIGGVEPTINNVPISGARASGSVPIYLVPATAFSALGEALIFFRLQFASDFTIEKIEPFAAPEPPRSEDYAAHKLALILFADGSPWRALQFNQGHLAINRHGGKAQHIFWAQ